MFLVLVWVRLSSVIAVNVDPTSSPAQRATIVKGEYEPTEEEAKFDDGEEEEERKSACRCASR